MMEVVYTWPSGRQEVRYRRPIGSADALELERQVADLRQRWGDECPYSVRNAVPQKAGQSDTA
jgi:hypothetical protein